LVNGSVSDHTGFAPLVGELRDEFTIFAMQCGHATGLRCCTFRTTSAVTADETSISAAKPSVMDEPRVDQINIGSDLVGDHLVGMRPGKVIANAFRAGFVRREALLFEWR